MNIFQGEEIVPPDQSREWKNLKLLIFPEENLQKNKQKELKTK